MAEPRQLEEMTHIRAEKPRNINKEYCYDWGIFCFCFIILIWQPINWQPIIFNCDLEGPALFYYGNILYRNDNDGIEIADPTGRNIVRDFVPRFLLDWRKDRTDRRKNKLRIFFCSPVWSPEVLHKISKPGPRIYQWTRRN